MKLLIFLPLCIVANTACHAQLQITPPGADTMTNTSIAKWYADKYQQLLSLSDLQKEQVYQLCLSNKNKQDSLLANLNTKTEALLQNHFSLDNDLKTVFTDKQYYDYLQTANIIQFLSPK